MKVIILTNDGWLAHLTPRMTRQQIVRNIFDAAKKHGWQVRLEGERWS